MAPVKSISVKKTTPTVTSSLKQVTLGFSSSKRTISAAGAKGKKAAVVNRTNSTPVIISRNGTSLDVSEDVTSQLVSSTTEIVNKRTASKISVAPSSKGAPAFVVEDRVKRRVSAEGAADLNDKEGRWTKHYGFVRERMGNIPSVHGENKTRIHHILRVFDLSFEYGPCVGVRRMDRWERAAALGLNPPHEIYEILSTKQGVESDEYAECVFFTEV